MTGSVYHCDALRFMITIEECVTCNAIHFTLQSMMYIILDIYFKVRFIDPYLYNKLSYKI